ncbi:hypothetical protein AB3Z07_27525 (plasmid) [Metabacillus halosaccharovorans]|uniref:hypothetical protein n=1 Tax=Metabacillus halosaccharovorans TaxID=930124 RepID=UPI00203B3CFA|nr:hypothetical protein [Metabacillus halosaccharovorans]MCM3444461.1 hypothetical protein [Metabacillus halosaccharovorans]
MMGVRLAFNLGNGEWLEMRRCDCNQIYAYLTNEKVDISDREIGQFGEKQLGEALCNLLYSLNTKKNE